MASPVTLLGQEERAQQDGVSAEPIVVTHGGRSYCTRWSEQTDQRVASVATLVFKIAAAVLFSLAIVESRRNPYSSKVFSYSVIGILCFISGCAAFSGTPWAQPLKRRLGC
jgi:drug/metabolite transporter (DMT)-like permease